jgi:hypothetical protein
MDSNIEVMLRKMSMQFKGRLSSDDVDDRKINEKKSKGDKNKLREEEKKKNVKGMTRGKKKEVAENNNNNNTIN